jgi:hypothetical protein
MAIAVKTSALSVANPECEVSQVVGWDFLVVYKPYRTIENVDSGSSGNSDLKRQQWVPFFKNIESLGNTGGVEFGAI